MLISRRGGLQFNPAENNPIQPAKRQTGAPAVGRPLIARGPVDEKSEHPKLFAAQAEAYNGRVGIFNTPTLPHVYFFNPGLIDYQGVRHLVCRRSFFDYGPWQNYRTGIEVFRILEDNKLSAGFELPWPKRHPMEQTDDPRVSIINGMMNISVCAWKTPTPGQKVVVHQTLAELQDWHVTRLIDVDYQGNTSSIFQGRAMEKNWLWFEHEGQRWCLYLAQPMTMLREEGERFVEEHRCDTDTGWHFGHIRGGTPPIRIGDEYITFFHSSLPWKVIKPAGMRNRYYAGAMTFEAKPPFKITRITQKPLLIGTYAEPYIHLAPPCVFPSGALLKDGRWMITYGINDCASGWLEVDHAEIEKLLTHTP